MSRIWTSHGTHREIERERSKHLDCVSISNTYCKRIVRHPVARGSARSKAPPLAARPVPWNGQGRRLVEVTEGVYSGGNSHGFARVNKVTPVS